MQPEEETALSEQTARKLREAGVTQQDIGVTKRLFEYVVGMDGIIFGDADYHAKFLTEKEFAVFEDSIALFVSGKIMSEDTYGFFPCGIAQHLISMPRKYLLELRRNQVKFLPMDRGIPSSEAEFLFSVAARVVRHRMHHRLRGKFKPFYPQCDSGSVFASAITDLVATSFQAACKEHGQDLPSAEDFDAKVIEVLVRHRIAHCSTEKEIRHLLWSEPKE